MNEKAPIRVAVTGAAGQIGYSLLFRIASGGLFGPDQPVALNLIEIEPGMKALEGVCMELDDCAFPLLKDIRPTSDLNEGFSDVNWALLVGSVPRKAGMERGDLLGINGKIFTGQGQAIQANAASDVRVLVVGNPCNTNCLIAMNNAQDVPADRWFAMTRLDENRAAAQLAAKANRQVSEVSNVTIWGNHSATQYPDYYNAKIGGVSAPEVISDDTWAHVDFIPTVQQRGAAIIQARGASSAASAANAAIDTLKSLTTPHQKVTGTVYTLPPTAATVPRKDLSRPSPSVPMEKSGKSFRTSPSTTSPERKSTPPSVSSTKSVRW